MPSLHELQSIFSETLSGKNTTEDLRQYICETKTLSSEERMSIYRATMKGGLTRALETTFPVCLKLVGEKYFSQLAAGYIEVNPSDTQNIHAFGKSFALFLEQVVSTRQEAARLLYLPDTAQLEWYWYQSLSAENDSPFDFQSFANAYEENPEAILFTLSHSAFLLSSAYPVSRIWRANQDDDISESISLEGQGERILVCRENFKPRIIPLDDFTWELLSSIKAGITAAEILAKLSSQFPDMDLNTCFSELIQRKWVVGFSIQS